jgi:hypothetical protein
MTLGRTHRFEYIIDLQGCRERLLYVNGTRRRRPAIGCHCLIERFSYSNQRALITLIVS